ncbi:hypothetical protein PIB30_075629, partial [Stylosanthes scabra]|nr:hypothetical protein [Stylosanthes scabra]
IHGGIIPGTLGDLLLPKNAKRLRLDIKKDSKETVVLLIIQPCLFVRNNDACFKD